jgi:hypothetical protein
MGAPVELTVTELAFGTLLQMNEHLVLKVGLVAILHSLQTVIR